MAIPKITENTRHIPWVATRSVISFIPFIRRDSSPPRDFFSLFAKFEVFLKYNLPEYIRDHRKYITSVRAYEAVTKIIMDLEKCSYEKATGIGLGEELPTSTPYGIHWQTLIEERDQRRETIRKQQEKESRKSKRKQKTPRKLRKTVPYHN